MEPREAGGALEQQQRFTGKQNDCWFIKHNNKRKTKKKNTYGKVVNQANNILYFDALEQNDSR